MQGSSTASSTSRSSGVDGNGGLGGGDSSEASEVAIAKCGRAGSPFADEDDLYADRDDGVGEQRVLLFTLDHARKLRSNFHISTTARTPF